MGIVSSRADLARAIEEHWYRIPIASAPERRWPPKWFAAFEPVTVTREGVQLIRSYAPVLHIDQLSREQLFPGMPGGTRAGRMYYRFSLGRVREREPIQLERPRRHPFIPTTLGKFERASSVNDLFDDSPDEDVLWDALKSESIPAQRQWPEMVRQRRFFIDFAVFCRHGGLAVEVDGKHHHSPEKAVRDDDRAGLLATRGWQVHHIPTVRIREALHEELDRLKRVINAKGGLKADGFVPRVFIDGNRAVQPALFEPRVAYDPLAGEGEGPQLPLV